MKKTLKKILSIALAAMVLSAVCVGFSGCKERYKEFKTDYFICREFSNRIKIPELTELGKEQEILIVPETIRGKPVVSLEDEAVVYLGGSQSYSNWQSDKLEKLFLTRVNVAPLEKNLLTNLHEIYIIGASKERTINLPDSQFFVYVPNVYDTIFQNEYLKFFTANIGYFYNYENSPNNNYYWIGHYAYGETITFTPPPPERKGYAFSGWYKEIGCINEWNFNTDRLPSLLINEDGNTVYQELKLYAKWIKN